MGDLATFSFYGNKIITTGEGGMVTTNDTALASRVRQLNGHGVSLDRPYWFPVIGYNYRMTNIAAAIGLAQLEKSDWHIERRCQVTAWYRKLLREIPWAVWQTEQYWAKSACWMFTIVLDDRLPLARDDVTTRLLKEGIETRPVFYPIHSLPPYLDLSQSGNFPVAERIAERGISLPTWAGLANKDVNRICKILLACSNKGERREQKIAPHGTGGMSEKAGEVYGTN
jgi:perosamine synthetase